MCISFIDVVCVSLNDEVVLTRGCSGHLLGLQDIDSLDVEVLLLLFHVTPILTHAHALAHSLLAASR